MTLACHGGRLDHSAFLNKKAVSANVKTVNSMYNPKSGVVEVF